MNSDLKIVFLDTNTLGNDISFEPITSLGDYKGYEETPAELVKERIQECNVLIINKIKVTKEVIDAAPNLKLICEAATGTDNIDIPYAKSKGIEVKNAVNYSTESVAQTTFMHILNLVGKADYFDNHVKSGEYSRGNCFTDVTNPFFELKGKHLGIIGLGNIGSRVAQIGEVFGMRVSYYPTSGIAHSDKYPALSLDELLASCDIISIHAPKNERTNNLITYDKLSLMKKEGYIINMGRGGIINEEDLSRALNEDIIAGAAVDVFVNEPFKQDHPYLSVKKGKLRFTPHIGWASKEARKLLVEKIAHNIKG